MHALLPVSAILLGVAILFVGNGLQGVLLPIRASFEGFSPFAIGLIGSMYFGGFSAGCLLGPRLVERVGHIRAFAAMTSIATATAMIHGLVPLPLVWWLLRIATGFCFAVLYMVIESWLNERSTQQNRGVVLSAYMIINLTVVTIGQMLLPLADPRGLELFVVVSILISLAAVPVVLTRGGVPAPIAPTRLRIGRLYRLSPAGVIACVAVGLAMGPFWALAPTFAQSVGLAETGVALFMSATVIGGALGQWPLGKLSDRGDRRRVILLAAGGATIVSVLLAIRPFESHVALFVLAAAWGAFAFPIYSLGVAHANDHAAPPDFVETSGGLLLVYASGAVVGPMLASLCTEMFGPTMLFAYAAAVHIALAAFVIWRMTQQSPVPDADHIKFAEALQATQTVSPVFDEHTQEELEAADR